MNTSKDDLITHHLFDTIPIHFLLRQRMIKQTQHIGLLTIIIIMLASPLSGFGCRTPSPFRYLSNTPCQTSYVNDAIQHNHIEQPAPILKNEFLMVIFFDLIIPIQAVNQFQPHTPTPPPKN